MSWTHCRESTGRLHEKAIAASIGNSVTPDQTHEAFRDKLVSRFQWLDGPLADKTFLLGDHRSVADVYLFVVTRWSQPMKIDLAALANVQAHHSRIAERPAVQEALRVEGLLK